MYKFPGLSSQHHYSGSAGYENHQPPYPPPHIAEPPHFHHVPHYQLGSGHVYPHPSQPTPRHPSDSMINPLPSPPVKDSGESRIPLPTMLARPPPPEQSAAVDGYRNVAAALSAVPSNQQFIFGYIRPQKPEENTNLLASSPELPANMSDQNAGNVSLEPRLPPFTIGVRQEDQAITANGSKLRDVLETGGSVSSRGPSITDRTNPAVTFQFGSLLPLDVIQGSTSKPAGELDQAVPVELDSLKSDTGDEWQVRDFGYGFGHMSGTGNAAAVVRDEINAREQRRVQERREREEQERRQKEDQEREKGEAPQDRSRRGSVNGGGYERGAYQTRRGRGMNGGYGRGYGRNFSRGGYSQYSRHQHQYSPTPPTQFSQLPSHSSHGYSPDQSVYFLPPPPPPPQNFGAYHPGGYEVYQYPSFPPPPALYPPVPHPISQPRFSLDPTRYYLLGQLEYYLSPQNMAQDFYLRKQASFAE